MQAATVDAKVSESEREIVAWWRALHAEVLAGHAVLDVAVPPCNPPAVVTRPPVFLPTSRPLQVAPHHTARPWV